MRRLTATLAIVLYALTAFAQSEHPVTGRRIAPVMGMGGAEWLERSEREMEEMPETALDAIGIKPGMLVADVGPEWDISQCGWRAVSGRPERFTPTTCSPRC